MAETKIETVLKALEQRLIAAATADGSVLAACERNVAELDELDPETGAFVNLLDGAWDERTLRRILSPPEHEGVWVALIDWKLAHPTEAVRAQSFDAGIAEIRDALHEDRTLGGLVDWVELGPPERTPQERELEGAPHMREATLPIRVLMTAPSLVG